MNDQLDNQLDSQAGNIDQARERLLDAGEKLFAENGFDGTSIRNITALANCNIAAVNYHFGNKDKLYHEVVVRRLNHLRDLRLLRISELMAKGSENITLKELLTVFANAFLEPIIDEEVGPATMQFWLREMLNPHLSKSIFLDTVILPITGSFREAMLEVCPGIDEKTIMLACNSIVGQLSHIVKLKMIFAGTEHESNSCIEINEIVKDVVDFTTAGIQSYTDRAGGTQ